MDYRAISVLIIAASLGISLVATIVGALVTGRVFTPGGTEVLSTVFGALIGVLASHLGNTGRKE